MTKYPRLLIVVVAVVVWSSSLILGFFLDDLNNLEQALNAPLTWEGLTGGFTVFDPATIKVWCLDRTAVHFFRPLFVLSLKLDHLIWGLVPFGYHLTNVLLHIFNALLVHRFLLLVGVTPRRALFAGLLFAGYPHHTVAIQWISGRTELLMATFVLGTLVMHLESSSRGRWWAWRLGALAAAACAFLTKEGAVVIMPFLVLAEWMVRNRESSVAEVAVRMTKRLWPFLVMTVVYLVFRLGVMGLGEHPPMPYYVSPGNPIFPLYVAVKTVYYYLCWLFALPIMPVAPVAFLLEHWWAAAGATLAVLGGWGMVMWKVRREPGVFTWLAWSLVALVPTAPVMASNHYTYLANIGVALLAVIFIALMDKPKQRNGQIGFTILVCLLHAGFGVANYHKLEAANRGLADQVLAQASGIEEGNADIYLVNLPFAAAHTGQRLRLLHGIRNLETHLLTVSSEPFEIGLPPELEWKGDRSLTMHLPDEWLSAELVQMFLMMDVDIAINHDYPAGSATATPLATARDTVDALRLTWPESVDLSRQYLMLVTQDEQGVVGVERLASGAPDW